MVVEFVLYGIVAAAAVLIAFILATGDKDRVGIAGALLGGMLGFAFGQITEQRRRREEDRHRFEADRRELYSKFLGQVRDLELAIRARHKAIKLRRAQPEQHPVVPDNPDVWGLRQVIDEIGMLCPDAVWDAAQAAKVDLENLANSTDDADDYTWKMASDGLKERRDFFIKAAKGNLAPLPPSNWQSLRKGLSKRLRRPTAS